MGSAQTDITNPYETIPCACIYCFVCLAKRLEAEEGEGWTCLRCGELVKQCRPWLGDVLVPSSALTSKKSVSFSEEHVNSSNEGEKGTGEESIREELSDHKETEYTSRTLERKSLDGLAESKDWSHVDVDSGIDIGTDG